VVAFSVFGGRVCGFGLVFVTGERVGWRWVVAFVRLGWSLVTAEGAGMLLGGRVCALGVVSCDK
jgi:hypothetical protein